MPISRLDFDFLIRLRRENCAYVCWIFFFGEGFDEIIVILTRSDLVETFDQIMGLTLRYVINEGFDRFESTNLLDGWCIMENCLFDELQ